MSKKAQKDLSLLLGNKKIEQAYPDGFIAFFGLTNKDEMVSMILNNLYFKINQNIYDLSNKFNL